MGNAWLVLPGKHSNFNDTSDEKNFIFTACGITIKESHRSLRGVGPSQLALEETPSANVWVPAVRSSQKQYDGSSKALLPSAARGTQPNPAPLEPSCGTAAHWPTHWQSQTCACQVQWSQYPYCFKLPFSAQEACKTCCHSGATETLGYPRVLSAFTLSFPIPGFPPSARAPSPPVNMLHLISCCDTISGT